MVSLLQLTRDYLETIINDDGTYEGENTNCN